MYGKSIQGVKLFFSPLKHEAQRMLGEKRGLIPQP
jgi:hypothetical protein